MEGCNIPVSVSPIWPVLCSSNLYKADETSGGLPQGEGSPVDNMSGRSPNLWRLLEDPCQSTGSDQRFIPGIRADHQRKEIPVGGHLSSVISTTAMQVSLPKEKLARIQQEARLLQAKTTVSVQKLAAFVGMTTAAKQAVRMAPLFHRHLQALINIVVSLATSVEEVKQSYHQMVEISAEAREELMWWVQEVQKYNGAPLLVAPPDMVIESDAS